MNYFESVKTLDDLRKVYHQLAFKHHPDKGGNTVIMQEINNQYETLTKNLINSHDDYSDDRKEYEWHVSFELRNKIEKVIRIKGVTIELIGSWLWITGNTFAVKETLKAEGFTFSPPKTAWFWHRGEYIKKTKALQSMEELRELWGTQNIHSNVSEQQSITTSNRRA